MDNKQWFKKAKFGMMVHFGLYSVLAGEYKGMRMKAFSEWIQRKFRIPISEYEKITQAFNPIYFDAEEWVKTAKEAGMQYIVVTSKHHDGFCLFKSDYDNYNVVDATPFKRDIIAELACACKKHGLKLGIYYSQDFDWHEKDGGGYDKPEAWGLTHEVRPEGTASNEWDFNNSEKNYDRYFRSKVLMQVRELLTNYGDICLMWFDTPTTISAQQSKELIELCKSLQPQCLINSRVQCEGEKMCDYTSCFDNYIPKPDEVDKLMESPCTINDTWGFKYYDDNYKTVDEIVKTKEYLNSVGVNYLLNVGPDHLGRIPVPQVEILKELGKRSK